MTTDDAQNESQLLNDILRIIDDGPPSLNSSTNTTFGDDTPAVNSDRDTRYEKILQQNILLATEMKKLWTFATELKTSVTTLREEKDTLEQELNNLNAYGRRNNIEIRNIPESIKDDKLESHCIDVFKSLNICVTSYDIVAVHRQGKFSRGRTRSVITRFVNRKHAYDVLENAHQLYNTEFKRYFVTENLCHMYRNCFNVLYKGKKKRSIDNVWSYNGIVYARMTEDDEPTKVCSVKDAKLFVETAESRKVARMIINNNLTITNTSLLNSTNLNTEAVNTDDPTSQSSPSADVIANDHISGSSPSADIVVNDPITESLPPADRVENDPNATPQSVLTTTNVAVHGDQNDAGEPVLCQLLKNAILSTPDVNDDEKNDGNGDTNVGDVHVSGENVEFGVNDRNGVNVENVEIDENVEKINKINKLLEDSV